LEKLRYSILPQTSWLDFRGPTYKGRKGERGQELGGGGKGKENGAMGGRKRKAGGKGEPGEGKERRDGEWRG